MRRRNVGEVVVEWRENFPPFPGCAFAHQGKTHVIYACRRLGVAPDGAGIWRMSLSDQPQGRILYRLWRRARGIGRPGRPGKGKR